MHIADFGIGMLGANGIVAGGIAIVTGAGLAAQMEGKGGVAVSFFGDGASNAGPFHECLNIAATWKLPMLYVCENNMYAAQTPAAATQALSDVAARAAGYGIPGVVVDGNDILAVYQAANRAVDRARVGRRPDADRVQDLPLARPHGAQGPARSSRAGGGRSVEAKGPDRAARATASDQGDLMTPSWRPSSATSWARSRRPSPSPRQAPSPHPSRRPTTSLRPDARIGRCGS